VGIQAEESAKEMGFKPFGINSNKYCNLDDAKIKPFEPNAFKPYSNDGYATKNYYYDD